jgi:hypothetical protein
VDGDIVVRVEGAGVVRARDGSLWLVLDLERGGATLLDDHRPVVAGLGDRTLVGGRLPEGAATAEVVDAAGERHAAQASGGAWAVLLDDPTSGRLPPVRFADAGEPCPACGGRAWDDVTPLDGSRGTSGGGDPVHVVVCRTCGHEESMGVGFVATDEPLPEQLAPDEEEEARRIAEEHERLSRELTLAELVVPPHAATGEGAPELVGWRSRNHVPYAITVRRGQVEVETAQVQPHDDADVVHARAVLARTVQDARSDWPERSHAGSALWLAAARRDAERASARLAPRAVALRVDGHAQRFLLVAHGETSVAVLRRAGLRLTVVAHDVDPADVALAHVDPAELG